MAGQPPRKDSVTVPCGTCLGCRADQGRQWAIRIMHESALHPTSSWFATLTYDPASLPETGTLEPDDVQLFMKRLRRKSQLTKISYYLCGEYGERNNRPHYHAAFFGIPFLDKEKIGERNGYPVFSSDTLQRTWGLGSTELTTLTWRSASYVAGYVTKKAREKTDPTKHLRVDPATGEIHALTPEFARMSRRPALGLTWLQQFWRDVYPNDFVVMDGSPIKPPRYYDRAMEKINPEIMEEVRHQRFLDTEQISDEKLIMAEKIHRARMRLFNRRDKI